MTTWTTLADHSPGARLGEPDARIILAVVLEHEYGATAERSSRLGAAALAGTASASIFLLIAPPGRPPADFLTYRYAARGVPRDRRRGAARLRLSLTGRPGG